MIISGKTKYLQPTHHVLLYFNLLYNYPKFGDNYGTTMQKYLWFPNYNSQKMRINLAFYSQIIPSDSRSIHGRNTGPAFLTGEGERYHSPGRRGMTTGVLQRR